MKEGTTVLGFVLIEMIAVEIGATIIGLAACVAQFLVGLKDYQAVRKRQA